MEVVLAVALGFSLITTYAGFQVYIDLGIRSDRFSSVVDARVTQWYTSSNDKLKLTVQHPDPEKHWFVAKLEVPSSELSKLKKGSTFKVLVDDTSSKMIPYEDFAASRAFDWKILKYLCALDAVLGFALAIVYLINKSTVF